MSDVVNHPSHYTNGKYEVIDVIEDSLTKEQFEGYCIGNVLKYVMRYRHKNGAEDLEKARWYVDRAIGFMGVAEKPEATEKKKTSNQEPLPCPFCGNKVPNVRLYTIGWCDNIGPVYKANVECGNCCAKVEPGHDCASELASEARSRAIELWNRRE